MSYGKVLSAVGCLLLFASPAFASLQLETTFLEQWFASENGGANTDQLSDVWSVSLTGASPWAAGVQINQVKITFDAGVYLDVVAGGTGFDGAFDFADTGSSAVLSSTPTTADGQTMLTLDFSSFGLGDALNFTVDVDNSNAVVRGTNGSGGNHDMKGATVDVMYTDNGTSKTAQAIFGAANPASPDDSAAAVAWVDSTPEPMSFAVWSALAMIGVGTVRRR